MITRKNMDRGLVLIDLFTNDFQKFQTEVMKLKKKDREQIAWWWDRCATYLEFHNNQHRRRGLEEFFSGQ